MKKICASYGIGARLTGRRVPVVRRSSFLYTAEVRYSEALI